MFGSDVLEVGIGLTLLFFIVSLMCSAVWEAIEILLKTRAKTLEKGLIEMLDDGCATAATSGGLTDRFYNHGLIFSTFQGAYKSGGRSLPSYVTAQQFSAALMAVVAERGGGATSAELTLDNLKKGVADLTKSPKLQQSLQSALDLSGGDLEKARLNIERWYDGTMERVSGWYKRHTQVGLFFIGLTLAVALNIDALTVAKRLSMDDRLRDAFVAEAEQVRQQALEEQPAGTPGTGPETSAQGQAAPVGGVPRDPAGAAAAAGTELSNSPGSVADGDQASTQAQPGPAAPSEQAASVNEVSDGTAAGLATGADPSAPPDPSQIDEFQALLGPARAEMLAREAQLEAIGAPIGWSPMPQQRCADHHRITRECTSFEKLGAAALVSIALGWLATAFAVTFGAPFWFDFLNKFMVVRSTVKPFEKSQPEGSEDRKRAIDVRLSAGGKAGAAV